MSARAGGSISSPQVVQDGGDAVVTNIVRLSRVGCGNYGRSMTRYARHALIIL